MSTPTPDDKAQYIWDRQTDAYLRGPAGSWAQRWLPWVCKHQRVRCTHGDEIIGRNFKRRVCLDCGRSLRGPLPVVCFFTDEPHGGAR